MSNKEDTTRAVAAAAPAAAAAPKPASPAERISSAVDAWYFECLHNSPAASEERVWNHIIAQKDALKRMLLEVV